METIDGLPGWEIRRAADGSTTMLQKTYPFSNYTAVRNFANKVMELGEELQHHSFIQIGVQSVTVLLTTVDVGGITVKDSDFARRLEAGCHACGCGGACEV